MGLWRKSRVPPKPPAKSFRTGGGPANLTGLELHEQIYAPADAHGPQPSGDTPRLVDQLPATPSRAMAAAQAPERADSAGKLQFFAGEGVKVRAEVAACDVFRIDGDFDGEVAAQRMYVSPTGVFKGTGRVDEAIVEGAIEGTLVVNNVLALRANARITGNVTYGQIEVERGAVVHGTIAPKDAEPLAAHAALKPSELPLAGPAQAAPSAEARKAKPSGLLPLRRDR